MNDNFRISAAYCLKSQHFGMYGPPLCRKRKVRIAGKVCAYVYGLGERVTTPGQDGMRFALFLFNLAVFKDLYRKQVFRATVRPWCHLFLRQQTRQEDKLRSRRWSCGCGNRDSDFQARCSSRRHLQASQTVAVSASSGGR
jgi:hypothetical protein